LQQNAVLDRRVVAAATQHPHLLQRQLVSYERWITLWLAQQQQQQQQQFEERTLHNGSSGC
jgi:hypothetical protein